MGCTRYRGVFSGPTPACWLQRERRPARPARAAPPPLSPLPPSSSSAAAASAPATPVSRGGSTWVQGVLGVACQAWRAGPLRPAGGANPKGTASCWHEEDPCNPSTHPPYSHSCSDVPSCAPRQLRRRAAAAPAPNTTTPAAPAPYRTTPAPIRRPAPPPPTDALALPPAHALQEPDAHRVRHRRHKLVGQQARDGRGAGAGRVRCRATRQLSSCTAKGVVLLGGLPR